MWDIRAKLDSGATAMIELESGIPVQDLEINSEHNLILTACNKKVYFLSLADLMIQKEVIMPGPMHFREEGGASLSPNGTNFIAVSFSSLVSS
jgi:hypothetical protein